MYKIIRFDNGDALSDFLEENDQLMYRDDYVLGERMRSISAYCENIRNVPNFTFPFVLYYRNGYITGWDLMNSRVLLDRLGRGSTLISSNVFNMINRRLTPSEWMTQSASRIQKIQRIKNI